MASSTNRVVIIGAGHNGLVAACYLAKAGYSPLVLERRNIVGGSAVTEQIHPGFQCPTLMHSAGLLSGLAADLQLDKHGLTMITPEVRVFAPGKDGPSISVYDDPARTARELASVSAHDAKSYSEFHASFNAIGKVMAPLLTMTPPSISDPTKSEL